MTTPTGALGRSFSRHGAPAVALAWTVAALAAAAALRVLPSIPVSTALAGPPAAGTPVVHHPLGDAANLALSLAAFAILLAVAFTTRAWLAARRAAVPSAVAIHG